MKKKPKSRWLKVAEIVLKLKSRVKSFVPLRGYSADELIAYYLNEFGSVLTLQEKTKLQELSKTRVEYEKRKR